jgi:hypothetical protein
MRLDEIFLNLYRLSKSLIEAIIPFSIPSEE